MQERIHAHDGRDGHQNSSIFQRFFHDKHVAHAHGGIVGRTGRQQLVQDELQREQIGVVQIDERNEIGVPKAHGIVKADGGKHRLGGGKHQAEENARVRKPVHFAGFLYLRGIVVKEAAHDDKIPGGHGAGQNHAPDGIQQPVAFHYQIGGDHAALEEHREYDHHGKELVADHALGTQRVSAHGRDAQRDGGAQHGVQDGVAVGTENTVVLEHIAVGFGCEALGPKPYFALHDVNVRRERDRQHMDHRQQDKQHDNDHKDI